MGMESLVRNQDSGTGGPVPSPLEVAGAPTSAGDTRQEALQISSTEASVNAFLQGKEVNRLLNSFYKDIEGTPSISSERYKGLGYEPRGCKFKVESVGFTTEQEQPHLKVVEGKVQGFLTVKMNGHANADFLNMFDNRFSHRFKLDQTFLIPVADGELVTQKRLDFDNFNIQNVSRNEGGPTILQLGRMPIALDRLHRAFEQSAVAEKLWGRNDTFLENRTQPEKWDQKMRLGLVVNSEDLSSIATINLRSDRVTEHSSGNYRVEYAHNSEFNPVNKFLNIHSRAMRAFEGVTSRFPITDTGMFTSDGNFHFTEFFGAYTQGPKGLCACAMATIIRYDEHTGEKIKSPVLPVLIADGKVLNNVDNWAIKDVFTGGVSKDNEPINKKHVAVVTISQSVGGMNDTRTVPFVDGKPLLRFGEYEILDVGEMKKANGESYKWVDIENGAISKASLLVKNPLSNESVWIEVVNGEISTTMPNQKTGSL